MILWTTSFRQFSECNVTLCLLITYHWPGSSTGSTGVWSMPAANALASAGIAAEVNGSPTDARLNIPVVKRSSNQAAFANELRSIVGDRDRVIEVAPTLFELPHEYANRDEEKYTTEKLADTLVVRKRVTDEEKEETKEKGKVVRGIESSIPAQDAVEARLIGKANSSPAALSLRRSFDYERASMASSLGEQENEEETRIASGDATEAKKEKKKAISRNDEENNRATIVGSVSAPDALDSTVHRARREARARMESEEEGGSSLLSDFGTIDSKLEKQRNQRQEYYDVSGASHRLSSLSTLSSLKPMERALPEKSKLTVAGEFNEILNNRRLHQRSRNTEPRTIIQHLHRNIKRQTSFDDNAFYLGNGHRGSDVIASAFYRNQREINRQQIPNSPLSSSGPEPELRFVPANRHRSDGRSYFQRTFKPILSSRGFQENGDADFPFASHGETNQREIPRFNAAEIEKLKNSIRGVFDKYEARQQGQTNLLPNVRMIQSKQILVAPPRVIYDTKILPAPISLNPFFQESSNNVNNDNDENQPKVTDPGFVIKGVFDQSHKETELDQKEVNEDSPPSLKNTRNFVTPLPPYRESGNGEVSVRVNQAAEDPNLLDEIYRVSGKLGISELENESQRGEEDEGSRLNHESPIEVGVEHHFGANPGIGGGGSSYDNSAGTSADWSESGSTNVDHSAVIEGTADEYMNRLPAVRSRTQSVAKSNDNTHDSGTWRDDDDYNHYAANYSFGYRVSDYKTENEFGHQETRNEGITKGKYHVKLPDGRIQKVNYHVDDGGYHASVSYHRDDAE